RIAALGPRFARSRLRNVLVAGHVAASPVPRTCAGLLLGGLASGQTGDPGDEARDVFDLGVDFGDDASKVTTATQRVNDRVCSRTWSRPATSRRLASQSSAAAI